MTHQKWVIIMVIHEKHDNWACSQEKEVPCWVPRPWEKRIFLHYMLFIQLFSIVIILFGTFSFRICHFWSKMTKNVNFCDLNPSKMGQSGRHWYEYIVGTSSFLDTILTKNGRFRSKITISSLMLKILGKIPCRLSYHKIVNFEWKLQKI